MLGPDQKMDGEVLEMGRAGLEGLCPGERELVDWNYSLPNLEEAVTGWREGGREGCCAWVNAMGDLAQTQQLD